MQLACTLECLLTNFGSTLRIIADKARRRKNTRFSTTIIREDSDVKDGINIANYEILHKPDPRKFSGVVLDESSILKGMNGKMRKLITEAFKHTQYKLNASATPSPNDYMELGTQSEFLGIMSQVEMFATFFIHDGGDTAKWRLKGHGKEVF